jgi:hypothetical protein
MQYAAHHSTSPNRSINTMWQGVIPAVTTKFKEDGSLDAAEMQRCFALQMGGRLRRPDRLRLAG